MRARSSRLHRLAILLIAPLCITLSVASAPPAVAATQIDPFAGIEVSQTGCATAEITSPPVTGARYARAGRRLHLPGESLRYNRWGLVELRAKPKAGYTLTRTRYEISAPSQCVTPMYLYDADVMFPIVVSWCDDDAAVTSVAANGPGSRYPVAAHWALTRLKTGRVVARSAFFMFPGFGQLTTTLPQGLPYGKFRLSFTIDEVQTPFPASYRVEHYRCVKPVAKVGRVIFRAPARGPDVRLVLFDVHAPDDDLPTYVTIKAGHAYRLRTTLRAVSWSAAAIPWETHVGGMGSGRVTVPQPTT